MPRLLHMADVHLGARHRDLGDAAARQRERQAAAFRRAIDAGLSERVDVALISGDLFDSNAQPRRTVEAAAIELRRLTEQGIRVVLIPGTHDCYEAGSIYRVFDLRLMAGLSEGSDLLTVLTPDHPDVVFGDLDLVVYGRVSPTKRASRSPLADFTTAAEGRARFRVAMIHGSMLIPGKVEQDDVLFTPGEVAASGLDYLALGHWHSWQSGRAGSTSWTYPGALEPLAVDQDGAGRVAIVDIDERGGRTHVDVREVVVGRTRFASLELDAAEVVSQGALVARLLADADPDLILDVRIGGVAEQRLEIDTDAVSHELSEAYLRVRVRDRSIAALPDGPLPPPETIAGTFVQDLTARIQAAEARGDEDAAADARAALQLGRLLLDDPRQVDLI
ncbi:MAG: DNA repair exonuclease [Chloroflexi bacterium]|nr:DNA repair exonuclease [Chloroflexota bacterium]